MAIKSMTGYARVTGTLGAASWQWEARSVNGRGLDIRLRLPPGWDDLEPYVRETAAKRLTRGSVTVALAAQRDNGGAEIRVNEAALEQILTAVRRIRERTGGAAPRPDGLLALKGVLEVVERGDNDADLAKRRQAMTASLDQAFLELVETRSREGMRLAAVLALQLDEIERLIRLVEGLPARRPEAVRARLADQVARLAGAADGLDPARLYQEAVLLAARADVEEELVRLSGHIAAARDLLREDNAAGRKLDFLAQEFNREANTLCAKSNDGEMTRAGLALKIVIDQFREQVQNIE